MFKNKLHKNIPIFSNTQQRNLKSQTRNPAVDHWTTQQLLPNTFSLEQWWEDFSPPIRYDIVLYSSFNFQNWFFDSLIIFLLYELFFLHVWFITMVNQVLSKIALLFTLISFYTMRYMYNENLLATHSGGIGLIPKVIIVLRD